MHHNRSASAPSLCIPRPDAMIFSTRWTITHSAHLVTVLARGRSTKVYMRLWSPIRVDLTHHSRISKTCRTVWRHLSPNIRFQAEKQRTTTFYSGTSILLISRVQNLEHIPDSAMNSTRNSSSTFSRFHLRWCSFFLWSNDMILGQPQVQSNWNSVTRWSHMLLIPICPSLIRSSPRIETFPGWFSSSRRPHPGARIISAPSAFFRRANLSLFEW